MSIRQKRTFNIWDIYNDELMSMTKVSYNQHAMENINPQKGKFPNCGDEIDLYIELEGDIIRDISFKGNLCLISKASSNYMIDLLKGKSIDYALNAIDAFYHLTNEEALDKESSQVFKSGNIFKKVHKLHGRINCALLPWNTLKFALNKTRCY